MPCSPPLERGWTGEPTPDGGLVFTPPPARRAGAPRHRRAADQERRGAQARRACARRAAGDLPAARRRSSAKDKETPISSPTELFAAVLEAGRKGVTIQRYKGLGEMNPEQLWETTLDPEARTLLQVKDQPRRRGRRDLLDPDGRRGRAAPRVHPGQRAEGGEPRCLGPSRSSCRGLRPARAGPVGRHGLGADPVDGAAVHAGTKLNFAATLGGASFRAVGQLCGAARQQPELGTSYFYSTPKKMVITVQVFDGGRRVPAGSRQSDRDRRVQQRDSDRSNSRSRAAATSIPEARGAVDLQLWRGRPSAASPTAPSARRTCAVYSKLLLTGYREHFVKIRIDWGQSPGLQQTSADADAALQAFVPALASTDGATAPSASG